MMFRVLNLFCSTSNCWSIIFDQFNITSFICVCLPWIIL
uniref:Uncharacterized protein n=1 Tax=Setaria italica TaxID=4555 RepID=K3YNS9_SETIT